MYKFRCMIFHDVDFEYVKTTSRPNFTRDLVFQKHVKTLFFNVKLFQGHETFVNRQIVNIYISAH